MRLTQRVAFVAIVIVSASVVWRERERWEGEGGGGGYMRVSLRQCCLPSS